MQDKTIKLLLFLIALGLFLNAAATFYNVLVPPAYAADSRIYLEGGQIEVRMDRPIEIRSDRPIPVAVDNSTSFDTFLVKMVDH